MENSSVNWSERKFRSAWNPSRFRAPFHLSKKESLVLSYILSQDFYEQDTHTVAKALLGKLLVVRSRPEYSLEDPLAQVTIGRIVEVEAYCGEDPAAHFTASKGGSVEVRATPRSAPMFEDPGRAYVYFIYGMYEMLNFVTEPKGTPGAVLIRAVEPLAGESLMSFRRKNQKKENWTNGPGRLTRAMGIEMSHNRESLMGPKIFVMDDGFQIRGEILCSPRVGLNQGKDLPWRYFLSDSQYVSSASQNDLAMPIEVGKKQ